MRIINSLSDLKDDEIAKAMPAINDNQETANEHNTVYYAMTIREYREQFPDSKAISVSPAVNTPAYIKKSIMMLYTAPDKLLEEFKGILKTKLMSGKTLEQTLIEARDYTSTIHGKDFAMWYKLFNFIQAIKSKDDRDPKLINNEDGILVATFKRDASLYQHFAKPQGNKNGKPYFTTPQKNRIDKWLMNNQRVINIPSVILNKYTGEKAISLSLEFIYRITEIISDSGKKAYVMHVNTHILDTAFHDYIAVSLDDIDTSYHKWDEITRDDPDIKKYRLMNFSDLPLRLIILIKSIYYRSNNIIYKKDGTKFSSSSQHLTVGNLVQRLGNLKERLEKHLEKRETSSKVNKLTYKLLDISFTIAKDMGYLFSIPTFSGNGQYHFNINPGTFDKQYIAKRLSDITT